MHAFDLTGRTALVTGAGSPTGIGFATAQLLAQMGAEVALASTTQRIHERVAQLVAEGANATGFVADLTDPDQVEQLPSRVDILVNNAGMISVGTDFEAGALESMSLRTWRAGLQRNLDTAFLVCRHVTGGMRDRGWGRIVNVASVTGPVMAMRNEPAYAAAKAGMVGLTRALAVDLASAGVTVNAVAPGWIATGSQTPDEARQAQVTPMGRSATPQEVAAAIAWFCTPGASYTTGQCLVVDGGNSIAEQRA
ncbi:MAG: SDR family oxidoreductase [Candidatus Nanopelagicales bacterium]|jgi:3-oxoacyl-[acyl-carrier protein] reductase|nr:SDR family oxidoreductase [Candidatus Nanopelagicales bacterium]